MKNVMSSNTPSPFQGEGGGEGESHPRNLKLVRRARSLRRSQTDIEKKLWFQLRDRRLNGIKFRRQYPLGRYVVDFVSVEKKLIIELDGGQHGFTSRARQDKIRDAWLREQGYVILRFWNNEVFENMEGVLMAITSSLSSPVNPHPNPLPKREME